MEKNISDDTQNNLAENIGEKIDGVTSKFTRVYADKEFGQIKLFGITGSILSIVGDFIPFGSFVGFIITMVAMSKIDKISNTRSFGYMLKGVLLSLLAVTIVTISLSYSATTYSFRGASDNSLYMYIGYSIATIMNIGVLYFFYKSYEQLTMATEIKLFKISGAMIAIGLGINIFASTLSLLLTALGVIGLVISWFGIKEFKQISTIDEKS